MRSLYILVILAFVSFPIVAFAAYEFVVFDGKVYEVTTETVPSDEIGTAIGEVKIESTELEDDASNVFPVGTFYFDIQGMDRADAIAVETSSGEFVKAVYTESSESGFSIWTILLGLVALAVVIVATMSFRGQRSHLKQYQD